ncbi:ester cyclase [Streptomyces kaniharaensis]|uniref:Ester cyclase n=1 Tax=Streptomyces kaniharaensis TaxID=212423 RepID=A0A6N7KV82_9ACTN|nr:ester cyclase [Streptomyces kaniharaensis]MQS15542.1 ester cyclase [Streptomyces kaniharaensis]
MKKKSVFRFLVVAVVGVLIAAFFQGNAGAADRKDRPTDTVGAESRRVVLGFYQEVLAKRQLDLVGQYMRDDYVQHSPGLKSGVQGYLQDYALFHSVFPDLEATIYRVVPQGDKVFLLATFRGHQVQTGKELVFNTAELYRVQDGKLAEHWDVVDYAAMEAFGVNLPGGVEPSTPTDWSGTNAQRLNLLRLFFTVDGVYRIPDSPFHGALAEDLIQNQPGVEPGLDGLRDNVDSYRERFPDLSFEITHTVADDDTAVVYWVWRGHEKGTGKPLELNRADVFRVDHGRFVEHWSRLDYRAVNPFGLS